MDFPEQLFTFNVLLTTWPRQNFIGAVSKLGVPDQVRSDLGKENVQVWWYNHIVEYS